VSTVSTLATLSSQSAFRGMAFNDQYRPARHLTRHRCRCRRHLSVSSNQHRPACVYDGYFRSHSHSRATTSAT